MTAANNPFDQVVVIPGPDFQADLTALDACHPVHYSRRLLIFRCDDSEKQRTAQLAALEAGLQALVLRCPLLAGTVAPLPGHESVPSRPDWRTILPGPGLELVVRDRRGEIPSFQELEAAHFPPAQLPYALLVPVPQGLGNDRAYAACKVQLTAIDGGTIVAFATSHCVSDGTGMNALMRVLADQTRLSHQEASGSGEKEGGGDEAPELMGMDRSFLRNIQSEVEFRIEDHPGYMRLSELQEPAAPERPHPFSATAAQIPVLLRISAENLTRLKADAAAPDAPRISTHDALAALIWRSSLILRSRRSSEQLPASTIGSIFLPSDARRHLGMQQSYVGNVVYQLRADLDLASLFSPSGLALAASAVRRAITAVTPELVASKMATSNEKWVYWSFLKTAATTGAAMGTAWTSGDVYAQDWGHSFGLPASYRTPDEPFTIIYPKLPDGTAELLVGVMPNEVELLKGAECFGNYLDNTA